MRCCVVAVALAALCGSSFAAQGSWTNFMYLTCYGDSNYWFASDAFIGGSGSNSFNHPQGILASTDSVYVIDTGNDRVVKLVYGKTVIATPEPSNVWHIAYATEWGTSGSGSNQLMFPTDAAFGTEDKIYIVDCSNNCIKICDTRGNWYAPFGSLGSGTNQFREPRGICTVPIPLVTTNFFTNNPPVVVTNVVTNTVMNVIVADYGNNRVVEYDPAWQFVRAISNIVNYPSDGIADRLYEIWGPYDVLVITDNLYITEAGRNSSSDYINARRLKPANNCNRFIMLTYSNGVYADDWNKPEDPLGNPAGGFTGNVYQGIRGLIDFDGFVLFASADNSQSQFLITDSRGYIIGKFGGASSMPSPLEGEFGWPYNLVKVKNFVFCADSGNNRVQMWKANSFPVFDYPKTNRFEVRELQVLSFSVHAKDDDGDSLQYSGILTPDTGGTNWGVNSDYMKFSMIPYRGSAGTVYTLSLTASDGMGSAAMDVFITVTPLNRKHKSLVKPPKAGGYQSFYEDWVYDPTNDGDLVTLKLKKTAVIQHWDGSVLEVTNAPSIALSAKRAKTLSSGSNVYDTVYGEWFSTNEVALGAVGQLDVVRAHGPLSSLSVKGTLGMVVVDNAALGKVSVVAGGLGGAEATTIKSISVALGKIKDPATKVLRMIGGDISGRYYPGLLGRIRGLGMDPKKGTSISSVTIKGGTMRDTLLYCKGHVGKVSVKSGVNELKVPVGGSITTSLVRAGYDTASGTICTTGNISSVAVSFSIENSSLIAAADSNGKNTFQGTAIDPGEKYYGSIKSIKYGKLGIIDQCLIVSSNAIKKLVADTTNNTVIINGVVQ